MKALRLCFGVPVQDGQSPIEPFAIIKIDWKSKNYILNEEVGQKMGDHRMTQAAVDSYKPHSTLTLTSQLSI